MLVFFVFYVSFSFCFCLCFVYSYIGLLDKLYNVLLCFFEIIMLKQLPS